MSVKLHTPSPAQGFSVDSLEHKSAFNLTENSPHDKNIKHQVKMALVSENVYRVMKSEYFLVVTKAITQTIGCVLIRIQLIEIAVRATSNITDC